MSSHPSLGPLLTIRSTTISPPLRMESPPQSTNISELPPLASYMHSNLNIKEGGVRHNKQASKKRSVVDIEARRQRNREHQARYQTKQKDKLMDLENSIGALKEEIQEFGLHRQVVSYGVSTSPTRWAVVAEYFRLFQNGVKESLSMNSEMIVPVESPVQRSFLQTTMTSDVVSVVGYGVEALLQNWKRISLCHPDIDIKLVRLENGPGNSLVAITKGAHTITEDTLRFAFPNLIAGSEDCRWLASRLLGEKFVMNGCTHFLWDNEAERVVSIQYTADLLTPMLHLLGNLEDVSKVFTNARLNPECGFIVS